MINPKDPSEPIADRVEGHLRAIQTRRYPCEYSVHLVAFCAVCDEAKYRPLGHGDLKIRLYLDES